MKMTRIDHPINAASSFEIDWRDDVTCWIWQ